VTNAANIWNASKELRKAKTECYARKAAASPGSSGPVVALFCSGETKVKKNVCANGGAVNGTEKKNF
jgi:predicted outer membrane repeat protein